MERAMAGEGQMEPKRMHSATDDQSTSSTTPTNTRNEDRLDEKPADVAQ